MNDYPVHCVFETPPRYARVQLGIRLVASIVLGMLGLSLVAVFGIFYVFFPTVAAIRVASNGGGSLSEQDRSRLLDALRWIAVTYAWFLLVVDELPRREPEERVRLVIEGTAHSTTGSALARLVTGIPAAIVLLVASILGVFVWIAGVVSILIDERLTPGIANYMSGLVRMAVRLLAYEASLVDAYPPTSFADSPPGFTSVSSGA